MKKLISIVCSLIILSASAFSCFALVFQGGSDQDTFVTNDMILSNLKNGFHTKATTLYLPQEYLNQAENYLNANGDNLTKEQRDEIYIQIGSAHSAIANTNATSFADLQNYPEQVSAVKTAAEKAASTAGLKIAFGEGQSVQITDANGNVVFATAKNGTVLPKDDGIDEESRRDNDSTISNPSNDGIDEESRRGNDAIATADDNDVIKTTGLGVNVSNATVAFSAIGLLVLASGVVIYKNKLYNHD